MPCPDCGGEWTQKSRTKLFVVGLLSLAAAIVCLVLYTIYWIAAAMLLAISAYLITWSTLGRGRWCSYCKKFSVS
jgi:hypothetical protein